MRSSLPKTVKNHEKPNAEIIQIRGPGNSITQFDRKGYVLTKKISDFEKASRKAIYQMRQLQCEGVVPLKKTKQFKFICSPGRIFVTALKLSLMNYEIESSGVEYYPKYVVGLKKKDQVTCEKFLRVMRQLPNIISINDNIQRDLT
ncbi:hypothetical protein Phum_PHUM538610 [Pediculus humanus corporis]|uniref:TACO1/YebC-like second and third domain-containing protein n=1 Tax=Pediculus humanus subsp. corporis TaxID=121224 RepID=E0VZV3_PEDHC|nr:uncharacterized protein Phum_PHUM538610 [Pediculus humanus corporis]EEB18909.1 hypothetical protein Phum_PHUM538610 [Pediculus humanus corporis]